jgi:hypothetical protein
MAVESISAIGERERPAVDLFSKAGPAAPDQKKGLSAEQEEEVKKLAERDREVRQHEQAHLAAAGQYARGGAKFSYKTGPDGKQYAVGGEVELNVAPIDNDPQATNQKARVIKKAALAPADPSPQDFRVAAMADKMESQAKQALAEEQAAEQSAGQGYNRTGQAVSKTPNASMVDFSA